MNSNSIERVCVTYFNNAVQSEKQSETSSVSIADLNVYLTSAPPNIRRHIKAAYNGDLVEFLRRYPEAFQLDGSERAFLTSDIIKIHGTEALERLSVNFFKAKLKSMKAFQHSAVPATALRKYLNDATSGVQSLFHRNYPGKDIKRFFMNHPEEFGVSISGNVYLQGEPETTILSGCNFRDIWPSNVGLMETEISKDEADAVQFYRNVLSSLGTVELKACSIDSLFAQMCEAPDNVQRFLKKNYNEYSFLDFFKTHSSEFSVTTSQISPEDCCSPQPVPEDFQFPPLPSASNMHMNPHSEIPWDTSQDNGHTSSDAEQAAIKFFEEVVKVYMLQNEVAHVDQLRKRLADAPLLVFSYFNNCYPYYMFDKFFLDHATHFSIDSSGAVELSVAGRNKVQAANGNEAAANDVSSSSADSEEGSSVCHSRNLLLEKQLEKFFLDLFNLAQNNGVRVVRPETLMAICSSCLNRRLSTYLTEAYGKNLAQFFQRHHNCFRVSKNGNICLTVEKESAPETSAKKLPATLAMEFFISLMQLLELHQVKAVPREALWEFLPLTSPKVQGFLEKGYNKDTLKNFLLKSPSKFALSKNRNIYLAAGPTGLRRDMSDETQDYMQASENPCEASALEFFVDLAKSLCLSTRPVPVTVLQENLSKASPFVRNYFDEVYPQEKFIDFFLKYKDFFFVLQPIAVVWTTQSETDDEEECVKPTQCPLLDYSKAFQKVVGVVAADLLVKSPKPLSSILGHLNIIKEQSTQELNKHQGKSKSEKLRSLVSNCFDMFKIVKDNVILSWPLKHHATLLSVLEEALAGVCCKLATDNMVDVTTFHNTLRLRTERMFQCLVPDAVAMLKFLRSRNEFVVLDDNQFIALPAVAPPREQVDEVVCLVEQELLKSGERAAHLSSILSALGEERFDHSFTCSTIVHTVLMQKDRFKLQDGFLRLLEEPPPGVQPAHQATTLPTLNVCDSSMEHCCTPVQGMGWVLSLGEESGILAATFGSSDEYAEVTFQKKVLSPCSTEFSQLILGQEVEFLAVRETELSEWVIVELKCAGSLPYLPNEECGSQQGNKEEGFAEVPSCDADLCDPPSEDDDTSTNGDDRIFYSSASDSEPTSTGGYTDGHFSCCVESEISVAGNKVSEDMTIISDSIADDITNISASNALETTLIPEVPTNLDNDEDWESPYDRRIASMSLYSKLTGSKGWSKPDIQAPLVKANVVEEPAFSHHSTSDTDLSEGYIPTPIDSPPDKVHLMQAIENHKGSIACTDQEVCSSSWAGEGIWDIGPIACETRCLPVPLPKHEVQVQEDDHAIQEVFDSQIAKPNVRFEQEGGIDAKPSDERLEQSLDKGEGPQEDPCLSVVEPNAPSASSLPMALNVVYFDHMVLNERGVSNAAEVTLASKSNAVVDTPRNNQDTEHFEIKDTEAAGGDTLGNVSVVARCGKQTEGNPSMSSGSVDVVQASEHLAEGACQQQLAASDNGWELCGVLPFATVSDSLEVVHSMPATVVYLCPTVALLVSKVRGSSVKLVLTPYNCASCQWAELSVGLRVAVRAVGDTFTSRILSVVQLRPLWSRPKPKGAGVHVATQTISTGPVLAASLVVD